MAGIGFELKKAFKGNSISKKVWGYSCASIVVGGPTILVIVVLIVLEHIANSSTDEGWYVLLALITYSMIGALLTASILTQVLARWSADHLFTKEYDRILPANYGAFIILIVPFGILAALLLSTADAVTLHDKIITWCVWALMTMIYIQMGTITAIKKYVSLVLWFTIGVITVILSALLFIHVLHIHNITSILLALFIGYGIIFIGYTRSLHIEFPPGHGSIFRFAEYMDKYKALIVCGFFGIAMSFVHIVIMWFFSEYSEQVTGLFYRARVYDVASFYAFLVAVPTNVLFVVSMETRFYEKFHAYFSAVSSNGTLEDVKNTRNDMIHALKTELLRLELIQLIVLIAYMALMRFYLETIGFTQTLLILFFLLCIGYAAQGIGASMVLLMLYFDDRKGAMLTALSGFTASAVMTLIFTPFPNLYGLGYAIAGLVMFLVGLIRINFFIKDVDDYVFARQPIFELERNNAFLRYVYHLDERALEKEKNFVRRRRKFGFDKEKLREIELEELREREEEKS